MPLNRDTKKGSNALLLLELDSSDIHHSNADSRAI